MSLKNKMDKKDEGIKEGCQHNFERVLKTTIRSLDYRDFWTFLEFSLRPFEMIKSIDSRGNI